MSKILEGIRQEVEYVMQEDLMENSRRRNVVVSRCLFVRLARTFTSLPYEHIGLFLNKDHSTMIHSNKMIDIHLFNDKKLKRVYDELSVSVKSLVDKNKADDLIKKNKVSNESELIIKLNKEIGILNRVLSRKENDIRNLENQVRMLKVDNK